LEDRACYTHAILQDHGNRRVNNLRGHIARS
jgi:hypothetical protein